VNSKGIWVPVSLVLIAIVVIGCVQSSLEIGMVETHLPGHWEASYTTFTGAKVGKIRAGANDTIILDYSVEVDKGNLSIEIRDEQTGVLWDTVLDRDAGDCVKVAGDGDGPVTITIEGDGAGGSFNVSWEVQ